MRRIEASAPTRIDLAGGTLDLWPLYLFVGGAVTINLAIDLYATAVIESAAGSSIEIAAIDQQQTVAARNLESLSTESLPLLARLVRHFHPKSGFRMETQARVPAGSGLGGSSTLAIAVCGALNEFTGSGYSHDDLIGIARDVEAQVLEIPTGEQDYYAAAYGGINAWHFEVNAVRRETFRIPLDDLRDRFLLFYTGSQRNSGINNWQVFKQYVDGNRATRDALHRISEESCRLHAALRAADWKTAGSAIQQEWLARKQLAPGITTPEIEQILAFGKEQGAQAGKVCGAGGGGCLFLLVEPERKPEIERQARQRGYQLLNCGPASNGLTLHAP